MPTASSEFHFPADIELKSSPLNEAWLEIRWQVEPGELSPFKVDPGFAFALGKFYERIKHRFGHIVDLEASQVPLEMVPYVVRHQFRVGKEGWPLLQLGPGVATVNFVRPYSWEEFKDTALYLRSKLVEAYTEMVLVPERLILRYQNLVACEHSSGELLECLQNSLNTSIVLPTHIPGFVAPIGNPTGGNISLTFDLANPKGKGTVRFASGTKTQTNPDTNEATVIEHIIFDLIIASKNGDAPDYADEHEFTNWLDTAHAVIHEWFFSLIEGPLREKFGTEE
jgi:uncharacterized protein (TIGR04255 family)